MSYASKVLEGSFTETGSSEANGRWRNDRAVRRQRW